MIKFFKVNINNLIFSILFFIALSLFFSINKILIPIIISIIFFFINKKLKKIILSNLIILILLIKILSLFFNMDNTLTNTIYEKHFLYGVRNLDGLYLKDKGDLTNFIDNKTAPEIEQIKITTDKFGFRNDRYDENFDYFLIGDSFLHQVRLNQNELINYQLKKNNINSYNAGISIYDISHYFEVIKFFKKKNKSDKKFIMFIYPPNDFISYGDPKKNYHKLLNSNLFFYFLEMRKFLNMYGISRYVRLSLKEKPKDLSSKVKSYLIKDNEILFYTDYMNSHKKEITFNINFSNYYKNYVPDLVVIIPSKFDVYCNFISEVNCKNNNYRKKIISTDLFKYSKIIDSTPFLIEKASEELQKNNFLYYLDDTHLNSLGSAYLSEFLVEKLKVEKILN